MKECPICHAKNGDGSETCYNCHASLNFKVYNAYNNQNKNQVNVSNKSNNTQNMQVNDTPNKGRGKAIFLSFLLSAFIYAVTINLLKSVFGIILGALPTLIIALIAMSAGCALYSFLMKETTSNPSDFKDKNQKNNDLSKIPTLFNDHATDENTIDSFKKSSQPTLQDKTVSKKRNDKPKDFKDKNNNNSNNTIKKRYCKFCGGLIDQKSKECTNCGKQYFKVPKANMLVSIVLVIIFAACTIFQFIYSNINSNKKDIDILSFSQFIECKKTAHLKMQGKPSTTYSLLVIRDDSHAQYTSLSCNSDSKGIIEFKWKAPFRTGSYSITVSDVNDEENTETVQMQVY